MRSSWKTLVVVAASALVVPQLATADEVQEQLEKMSQRMSDLEQKLEATTDELDAANSRVDEQQRLIGEAGLDGGRTAKSGLSSFLEQTMFSGHVAGSYFYNTNNPDNGAAAGANGGGAISAYPFHPDSNSFQVDQVWFSMEKAASPESRAGFAIDMLFGKTADNLPFGFTGFSVSGNGDGLVLYQAYAEYLAPIGPGVSFKAGRFGTHIGAESAKTTANYNITRGHVYSLLQPVTHNGVTASMAFDSGLDLMVGIANDSLANTNTDLDDDKTFLWRVGFAPSDQLAFGINGLYGGNPPVVAGGSNARSGDKVGIVNAVVNWDPSDNLSTLLDVTYLWERDENVANDLEAIGVAIAGRLGITESTGFALRGEYVRSFNMFVLGGGSPADQDIFSLTGTVDHSLTENLLLKLEARWDYGRTEGADNNIFFQDENFADLDKDQVVLGAELTYSF